MLVSEKLMHPNSVRVIAGKFRRRKVSFNVNLGIRPTPDRVRETLFNWLQADCVQARCLDLCAGSGILGIEALSRGAHATVFVDSSAEAMQDIQHTLAQFGVTDQAVFFVGQAEQVIASLDGGFNLIFIDPPYHLALWDTLLASLHRHNLLAQDAKIYIETPKSLCWKPSKEWQVYKRCCYASVEAQLLVYVGA